MNSFMAVFKRELKGYFATPVAYVFLVIFIFASGLWPFIQKFFEIRQADMRLFFTNLPTLFMVFIPAVAMRLWAEERKSGSIELLLTLPITVPQAVLGKFFAAWIFLAIALILTIPMPLVVLHLGDPDVGQIITGYLGAFLMAGGFLAIGTFFSAVTRNQVISFILSVVACAVLVFADNPTTLDYLASTLSPGVVGIVENLSFKVHFESMMRGVVEFRDIAYFAILIAAWVYGSMLILEERKAD